MVGLFSSDSPPFADGNQNNKQSRHEENLVHRQPQTNRKSKQHCYVFGRHLEPFSDLFHNLSFVTVKIFNPCSSITADCLSVSKIARQHYNQDGS
jgi:hypothetical protein